MQGGPMGMEVLIKRNKKLFQILQMVQHYAIAHHCTRDRNQNARIFSNPRYYLVLMVIILMICFDLSKH